MSDPIPGIAKKLYRVWCQGTPSLPPWDELDGKSQNGWVQVASAACIAALGSDHIVNALRDSRTRIAALESRLAEGETLAKAIVTDHCASRGLKDKARAFLAKGEHRG